MTTNPITKEHLPHLINALHTLMRKKAPRVPTILMLKEDWIKLKEVAEIPTLFHVEITHILGAKVLTFDTIEQMFTKARQMNMRDADTIILGMSDMTTVPFNPPDQEIRFKDY